MHYCLPLPERRHGIESSDFDGGAGEGATKGQELKTLRPELITAPGR
jgi:hypothetical protein